MLMCPILQEDMEGWMKALSCANYDFLRNTVAELQRFAQHLSGMINDILR